MADELLVNNKFLLLSPNDDADGFGAEEADLYQHGLWRWNPDVPSKCSEVHDFRGEL